MKSKTLMPITILLLVAVLTTAAHAQFSILYNFGSKSGDPSNPVSGTIAQGRDGNLYSTAETGGASNAGAVFKITPGGTLSTLYSFTGVGNDEGYPDSGLSLGTDGSLYGTTRTANAPHYCCGTVFKLTPSGRLTTLHKFTGSDGASPFAAPVQGTDGNWYGTTSSGGANGNGTVYKLTPSRVFTSLYQFDYTHGGDLRGPLVQGTDGNFYGTTLSGGTSGNGVVFKITTTGKLTVLHSFDGTDGSAPFSPLVQDTDGNFYGTTLYGGTTGFGVVFKITPSGRLTVLHSMHRTTDGRGPVGALVKATDGNFYGANGEGGSYAGECSQVGGCGSLFKIAPNGSFSVLHTFDFTTGSAPQVTLLQHTNGIMYGDTELGGTSPCNGTGCGVFYRWRSGSLPAFVSLLPYSGKVGNTIQFLGQGFTSSTTVSFNGTAAARKVVSSTYLIATVPKGATTGFVTVTTSSGKLKSNKIFRVIP